jgi:uracil-DNA glycosylase family 4
MNQSSNRYKKIYLDYFLDIEGNTSHLSEILYKDIKSSLKNIKIDSNTNKKSSSQIEPTAKPSNIVEKDKKNIQTNFRQDIKESVDNTKIYKNIQEDVSKINNIEELLVYVKNIDHPLKYTANKLVFGDGNLNSKIMLIGEAPGADEDEQGIPFCGKSGILLMNAIKSIGLEREKNFYITNTVFWRPPANRKPTQHEMDMCFPILERKINIIKPELIILVGSSATESTLKTNKNITSLRKNFTNIQIGEHKTTTIAIYHPSYILRSPNVKADYWFDLIEIEIFLKNSNIKYL